MADQLLENLDNLETLIIRDLPYSLDRQAGLEAIKLVRRDLIDLWGKEPEIRQQESCPHCGGDLRCRECNWQT